MTEQTPGTGMGPAGPNGQQPGGWSAASPAQGTPAPYPAYPPYAYYPQYAHWYVQAYTQPPTPVERPASKGGRTIFYAVAATLAVGLTIGALALAAAAPALVDHVPTASGLGLTSLYSSTLKDDTTNWDVGHNCSFEDGGLHADGTLDADNGAVCTFQPSAQGTATTSDFLVTVHVAPAMNVASEQVACILIMGMAGASGNALLFDQSGGYATVTTTSNSCGTTATIPGSSVAWHTDGYEPNTISVWYSSSAQNLTVYANGQRLYTLYPSYAVPFTLALGAPGNAEALYTGFTIAGGATSA